MDASNTAILTWVGEEVPTLGEWLMGSLERGCHHIFMFIERNMGLQVSSKGLFSSLE